MENEKNNDFRYFVTYVGSTKNGEVIFGNREISCKGKIQSIDDINDIIRYIGSGENFKGVTLINYKLLRIVQ